MGYRVGERAGPYEVLQLLGRGTFGEVLLAVDTSRPQHRVALKTVACDQLAGESADRIRQAALHEAQLLGRLRHPHIVRCEEVQWDVDRRVVWLALEYMEGGDAQNLIDRRRNTSGEFFAAHFVRRVLAAVGSALCYIHQEGILHRDVKPANVLLARRSQRIKLGDFGISKLLEASRAHTVVGTPYYLSPEIVSGQAYGAASDAWALGVCLYEIAALRRPFEAGNPLALVRRICEEPPTVLPDETAMDLRGAILGLLERDVDVRINIQTALQVSDAVAALAAIPAGDEPEVTVAATGCSPEYEEPLSLDFSPERQTRDGRDLSPVSMASSESAYGSSYSGDNGAAHLVASLTCVGRGVGPSRPCSARYPPRDGAPAWHRSPAVAMAHAALGADVDDPEELQLALCALEHEAVGADEPCLQAFDALSCELRLRIGALRADAAALIQSLIDAAPFTHSHGRDVSEHTAYATAEHPCHSIVDTVTTVCIAANMSHVSASLDAGAGEVAALETAIELATSLGVDTGVLEERAPTMRGLLSLHVVWGSFVRFCLLPLSVSFGSVVAEVARRFNLPEGSGVFELWWREGAEV
jgi:serine/threonine protein kinase